MQAASGTSATNASDPALTGGRQALGRRWANSSGA